MKSLNVSFETMKANIKQGEHWIRNDWKDKNKYVILADERYCTPCLLLVLADINEYYIYKQNKYDFKYNWHLDGKTKQTKKRRNS